MPEMPWTVEFYRNARGESPAFDFVDKLPVRERAVVTRVIGLLERYGPLLRMPYARHLEADLWELRAGAGRVLYFLYDNGRFILLHAYRKKTDKTPAREIATARRRMRDYRERHTNEH